MRKFILFFVAGVFSLSLAAQDGTFSTLPSVSVKDLRGNTISSGSFENDGRPIIISFWATWCKPCIAELNAIRDMYPDWVEETGVKLIAISIDDARNAARVRPFVLGQGWEYEVYLDENSDLRRALNVNNPPHTFLLNGNKEIVWQHNGYVPGDEDVLYELVEKLAAGQTIK
ncbi:MAG: TlpA family protein disulfide reductase [Flavobacteriales bacterium]|nr:MAG: TlpA family protein disulfide reductase [Flavobacteriales bacterium]